MRADHNITWYVVRTAITMVINLCILPPTPQPDTHTTPLDGHESDSNNRATITKPALYADMQTTQPYWHGTCCVESVTMTHTFIQLYNYTIIWQLDV